MKLVRLLQLLLFLCVTSAFSQLGIGTTDPNLSAQLEIIANDKGVLIPKIALNSETDATTIANGNVEGLLVYNINTSSGLTLGYYYWSNAKWNKLSTADATTIIDNLTTGGTTDALSAEQGKDLKGLVDTNSTAIGLNTAKITNVATDLTITGTTDARTIVSSDGTDAVIPVATTLVSGLMSTTLFDAVAANTLKTSGTTTTVIDDLTTGGTTDALSAEQGKDLKGLVDTNSTAIGLNTAKITNVATDLTITGTTDARTIVSSDGTDAVIPVATTLVSGLMSTTLFDAVAANTLKTSGTTTTVIDDLTTGGTTDALSAEQGKDLKGLVDTNSTAIGLNTAKITNVATDLTITGTTDARTIVSSDGTDAVIPVATTLVSGLMSTTLFDAVAANTLKTSGTTTTVIDNLTTGGTTDALSAEQGKDLKGLVDTNSTAIGLNTAKITNVATDLTITGTTDARTIVSSDGTDAVIPVATTLVSGLMSTTLFDAVAANTLKTSGTTTTVIDDLTTGGTTDALSAEQGKDLKGLVDTNSTAIGLNTAKITNVATDLTITGTTDARTIVSSDGTDAVIPVATTLVSGLMSTTLFDAVAANTLKTSGTTTTVIDNLTTGGTTDALSAEQGKDLKGLVDTNSTAIGLNTAKITNVATDLTITGTTDARTIVSSDGTDAVIPVATTLVSGLMSTALFDAVAANTLKTSGTTTTVIDNLTTGGTTDALSAEQGKDLKGLVDTNSTAIGINTAKITNVATDLTITGTTDARTIVSSDGTDAVIPVATTLVSGLMSTALFDAVAANTAKSVTDALTSTSATDALSANQGKVLEDTKLNKTLADGTIFIGDATNIAVTKSLSGDATLDNTGALTIADDAVDGTDISLASETQGDMAYFDGTDWVRLPKGAAQQSLVMDATGSLPQWQSGGATEDVRVLLGSGTGITNGNSFTISQTWGSLEAAYESVEFEINATNYRNTVKASTANWIDNTGVYYFDNGTHVAYLSDMDTAGTTGTLVELATAFDNLNIRVYGIKAQKTVVNPTDATVIDDDTFASATASNVPSAESVKAYVDANVGSGDFDSLSDTDVTGVAMGAVNYFDGTNWVDLPAGTAGQSLIMNAGATAPEWQSGGATEDVETVEGNYLTTATSGSQTILANNRTWADLKTDYEKVKIFVHSRNPPPDNKNYYYSNEIYTADIIEGSILRIQSGVWSTQLEIDDITTSNAVVHSTGWSYSSFKIVGIKAQKTVIDVVNTPVNDQASSGYMDIGDMRIQWGVVPAGVAGQKTVTLPTAFANNTYSITLTTEYNGTNQVTAHCQSKAMGSFVGYSVENDSSSGTGSAIVEGFSWQAIGLKP